VPRRRDAGGALDAFIAGLGTPRSRGAVNIGPENFDRSSARSGDHRSKYFVTMRVDEI
jgi:hypothetical protein